MYQRAMVPLLFALLLLLLCHEQCGQHERHGNVSNSVLDEYQEWSVRLLAPPVDRTSLPLPLLLRTDRASGCLCRATADRTVVVCFGNYECKRFPKQSTGHCDVLVVRTTVIVKIETGELDSLFNLKVLKVDGNSRLASLQPTLFRNLTALEQLSLSYNTQLRTLHEQTFVGLQRLRNLTLVNNGFLNIALLAPAFKPMTLPSLTMLDLSENTFGWISRDALAPLDGSLLSRLDLNLCRLDYIHPDSFVRLQRLRELRLGENDLSPATIVDVLKALQANNVSVDTLGLSSMGFRKRPPMELLRAVQAAKVRTLSLADNQFEVLNEEDFPAMLHMEVLDLRKTSVMSIGVDTFGRAKFPRLRVLLLGGNNLPGIHVKHVTSPLLLLLDLSANKGTLDRPMYYEIGRGVFAECRELRFLNLAFNRLKHIYDHTFTGLRNLRILNMENGTIFHIGEDTFKPLERLELLNLGNNPLTANQNLTSAMFAGLRSLRALMLHSCGLKRLQDDDNIFEMMPNLTHLVLTNNQLLCITAETLKPLKLLKVLDLSQNFFVSWGQPLFLAAAVRPAKLYLMNNKITHFTASMMQDLDYLLENSGNRSAEINLGQNLFACECSATLELSRWVRARGLVGRPVRAWGAWGALCSSPDAWQDRRLADYLASSEPLRCELLRRASAAAWLVWTAPSLLSLALFGLLVVVLYKNRMYISYWLFLAKLAVGRSVVGSGARAKGARASYRFDAFVSYCTDDREFVSRLTRELEGRPPHLRLCIYERDFEIGSFISESILAGIDDSRFVILVISDAFAKSQWCRWETHLAESQRILGPQVLHDPLVLIKLGEVQRRHLTNTLRYLLDTKVYHSWSERNAEQFFSRLRHVIVK